MNLPSEFLVSACYPWGFCQLKQGECCSHLLSVQRCHTTHKRVREHGSQSAAERSLVLQTPTLDCSKFNVWPQRNTEREADMCYPQRQTIVDSFCLSPPSSEISAPGQEVGSMMRALGATSKFMYKSQGRLCKKRTHSIKQNSSCHVCVLYTLSIIAVKSGKHNGISLMITLTSMTKKGFCRCN